MENLARRLVTGGKAGYNAIPTWLHLCSSVPY
jgi:hypothetical protein